MIHLDKPISNCEDDLLGYCQIATKLSNAILDYQQKSKDGFVIGLQGEWGVGKTSIINLLKKELQNHKIPKNSFWKNSTIDPVIVIEFNPWYFSTLENLFFSFFNEIAKTLENESSSFCWTLERKIGKLFKQYGALISDFIPNENLKKIVNHVLKEIGNDKTINQFKEELNSELKKLERPILIIIDDLDRLFDQELMLILQLVKGVANFDNVFYLLSFDPTVVAKSIETFKKEKGLEYLQKIVQFPINVPMPSESNKNQYFFDKLDKVLKEAPSENVFNHEYWSQIYHTSKYMFANIRDINRFINSFRFDYFSVASDVNFADFFAISAFKMFDPEVYNFIRDYNDYLFRNGYTLKKAEEWRSDAINFITVQKFKSQDKSLRLLKIIFPEINEYLYHRNRQFENTEKRISDKNYFDTYFQLSVPLSTISHKEQLEAENAVLIDVNEFIEIMREFDRNKKALQFLDLFKSRLDQTLEFHRTQIKIVVENLLICAHQLEDNYDQSFGFFEREANDYIVDFAQEISQYIQDEELIDFIKFILNEKRISLAYRLQYAYRFKQRDATRNLKFLTSEQFEIISNEVKELMKNWMISELVEMEHPFLIFSFWTGFDPEITTTQKSRFIQFMDESPENIFKVINAFKTYIRSTSGNYFQVNKVILKDLDIYDEIDLRMKDIKTDEMSEAERSIYEMYFAKEEW